MSVTASLGSFVLPTERPLRGAVFRRRELDRLVVRLFNLRFAMVAGIVTQIWPISFLRQPTAGVEAIEVEDRVEHKRISAARFAAIHRIYEKQHDVSVARWHIHDSRVLRYFVAALHKPGD